MGVETFESTSSGAPYSGKGLLHDVEIGGSDGSNDITVTIYDNDSAASGKKLLPTHVFDASAKGLGGLTLSVGKNFTVGVYVEITTSGTAQVLTGIEGFA